MSRYDIMTPAEILRTMGLAQKELLTALPKPVRTTHPSSRQALVTRGLARESDPWGDADLVATERGLEVADLVHADVAEDTWEATS